jgi:Peptidase_C39 like family
MPRIIRPLPANPPQYRGLESIFEYTNNDGDLSAWNCGQAAAATFLTHHGAMDPAQATSNMACLEKHHPPDQLLGWLGTGRRRIERIMRSFNLDLVEVNGIAEIRRQLDRKNPVLLMLGIPHGKYLGFNLPGGHWMVAYGYDARTVHLTNGPAMTWEEVEASWHSIAGLWIRMNGRGLAKRE